MSPEKCETVFGTGEETKFVTQIFYKRLGGFNARRLCSFYAVKYLSSLRRDEPRKV